MNSPQHFFLFSSFNKVFSSNFTLNKTRQKLIIEIKITFVLFSCFLHWNYNSATINLFHTKQKSYFFVRTFRIHPLLFPIFLKGSIPRWIKHVYRWEDCRNHILSLIFKSFPQTPLCVFCCFSNCNEMRKKNEEKNSRERLVDIPAIDESNACSSVCWLSI